jgi:toxin ParE1/3/4
MADFRLTRAARSSLIQIGLHTEQRWGLQQRMEYLKAIDDGFQILAKTPMLGQVRPEIHDQLRSYPVRKHVVFYFVREDELVVIVDVLHERTDPVRRIPMKTAG